MRIIEFRLKYQWNLFAGVQINNELALVQVMAWHRTDDELLPEPMLTQFTDAYMRH